LRDLDGRTALVTGGGKGIGRATAEAFLRQGMKVAIGDVDIEAARQENWWGKAITVSPEQIFQN